MNECNYRSTDRAAKPRPIDRDSSRKKKMKKKKKKCKRCTENREKEMIYIVQYIHIYTKNYIYMADNVEIFSNARRVFRLLLH